MNSSSLSCSSRNSICPCGGKTTKKQVSSVLLPLVVLPYHSHYRTEGFLSLFNFSTLCRCCKKAILSDIHTASSKSRSLFAYRTSKGVMLVKPTDALIHFGYTRYFQYYRIREVLEALILFVLL